MRGRLLLPAALLLGPCAPAAASADDLQALDDTKSLLQVERSMRRQSRDSSRSRCSLLRQALHNVADLQYSADLRLGGQGLRGVLDTGSFEVLAFSKACPSCGQAGEHGFDASASSSYREGRLQKTHTYGSGSVLTYDGSDTLAAGCLEVPRQDVWLARQASMPVLASASFQAIVGLGPPGEPQREVARQLEHDERLLGTYTEAGVAVPASVLRMVDQDRLVASIVRAKNDSVLLNLGVRRFSACFEWASGAPGYIIWNDTPPAQQLVPFAQIDVTSDISWKVAISGARFRGPEGTIQLGCSAGCDAILDTGTSLVAVPSHIYRRAFDGIAALDANCTNLGLMPDLVFSLGGREYSLPPQSYIGVLVGTLPEQARSFLATEPVRACQLLLMDSGQVDGALWILGMPFFRYYYTTFDLGDEPLQPGGRKIWTAPATPSCEPAVDEQHTVTLSHARRQALWRVDATKIRVPHWLGPSPGAALAGVAGA